MLKTNVNMFLSLNVSVILFGGFNYDRCLKYEIYNLFDFYIFKKIS